MKKFTRVNKNTGEEIKMFGTDGIIKTISKDPKVNVNGNKFYTFTAQIDMPRGKILCLGQVYEKAFEFLDGKPEPGNRFAFATQLDDLMEGNNKVWSISGLTVDEIDESLLADIDML